MLCNVNDYGCVTSCDVGVEAGTGVYNAAETSWLFPAGYSHRVQRISES